MCNIKSPDSLDQPTVQLAALRAMGSLWKLVQEHLRGTGQWSDGMRLGTTGRPGSLYVAADGEAWELFALRNVISESAGKQDIAFDEDAGARFKISAVMAATMVEKRLRSCSPLAASD